MTADIPQESIRGWLLAEVSPAVFYRALSAALSPDAVDPGPELVPELDDGSWAGPEIDPDDDHDVSAGLDVHDHDAGGDGGHDVDAEHDTAERTSSDYISGDL